ncbi:MAG: 2-hydroxyacyl-CoA dehydratase [bacterium]|nr:2-hydroxyacyl-CoA dehydratase [bacterium]
MTSVLYSCPFVPAEWIAAHGMHPCRTAPSRATGLFASGAAMGMCPYAVAFSETAMRHPGAVVVMTTACDQMRRASEMVAESAPVFLMHVPATVESPDAHGLYRDELMRLGRFLVMQGGSAPSTAVLADTLEQFNATREALRHAWPTQSGLARARALMAFHREGIVALDEAGAAPSGGPALALVGGPLLIEDMEPGGFLDLVEQAGGRVVLDATASGERGEPAPFDRRRLRDDPLGELADAYFGRIPDAFQRPNGRLYRWLKDAFEERGVEGILFHRYTWCDTWHAEAQRMKEWADLPMLAVDIAYGGYDGGRVRSRIEAFVEMLR